MSDYTPVNDFTAKDALTPGDPNKIIKGSDVDAETAAAATAIASKPDQNEIQDQTFEYFVASGTDIYTATPSPAITAYTEGQSFDIKFTNANTTVATINLNGLGPKSIRNNQGAILSAGNIAAGTVAKLTYDGTNFQMVGGVASTAALPRTYLSGFTTSRDSGAPTTDINILPGQCIDSGNATEIVLATEITKQLDNTWAAGDDAGGRPAAVGFTADTWYHVFVIFNPTTGDTDAGFDTDVAATNLLAAATGYTVYRRIGSVLTDGSIQILDYTQVKNKFWWAVGNNEGITLSATAVLETIQVPLGIQTIADLTVHAADGNFDAVTKHLLVTSPSQTDTTPSASNFTVRSLQFFTAWAYNQANTIEVLTNTSSQVRHRVDNAAGFGGGIITNGYTDYRGQE